MRVRSSGSYRSSTRRPTSAGSDGIGVAFKRDGGGAGDPAGDRPAERLAQQRGIGLPGWPGGLEPADRRLAGLGVCPPVGDLPGPRGEQVVERIEGLDAVMGRFGQERLADIAVQPLLFPPPFRLTGQSHLMLWITRGSGFFGYCPGPACAFETADGFLVAADFGGDGFEAAAHLVDLDGQAGQGGGVLAPGAVLVDDGAQVGPPVEGGAADPRACCDCRERDGLPGRRRARRRRPRRGSAGRGQLALAWPMSRSSRSMRRRWRAASSPQPRASASAARASVSARCSCRTGRKLASLRKFGQCSQMLA